MKPKIAVGITGASGAIYARLLIRKLLSIQDQLGDIAIVYSANAEAVWQHELGEKILHQLPVKVYGYRDFFSPLASGSAQWNSLIVCPCSMGTLARIAHGFSEDLISRSADVMLKERRKLVLVCRETPLNMIHIKNMLQITEAGGIVCPASPSFYSNATTIEELALTVVNRALELAGISSGGYQWAGG